MTKLSAKIKEKKCQNVKTIAPLFLIFKENFVKKIKLSVYFVTSMFYVLTNLFHGNQIKQLHLTFKK